MSIRRRQKIKIPGVSPADARPAIATNPVESTSSGPASLSQLIPWLLVVIALGTLVYLGDLTLLRSPETPLYLAYCCLFTLAVLLGLRGWLFRFVLVERLKDPFLVVMLSLILLNCAASFHHQPGPYGTAAFALLLVAAGGLIQSRAWWTGIVSGIGLVFVGLAWHARFQDISAFAVLGASAILSFVFQYYRLPGLYSRDRDGHAEDVPRNLLQAALLSGSDFEGFVVHEKGIIKEANSTAAAMFGYSAEEFRGLDIMHLLTRDSRPLARESLLLGNFHPLEVSCLRRNGGTFRAQVLSRSLAFQEREFMLAIIRDVSDKNHLASALEETRRQLESFQRRQTALIDVERWLETDCDLPSLLSPIARAACHYLPATLGAHIVIRDALANSLRLETSCSNGTSTTNSLMPEFTSGPATDWILDHQESLVIPEVRDDPFGIQRVFPHQEIQAYAGVPIQSEGTVLGVLFILEHQPRVFRKEDLDFMDSLAGKAALAILKTQWNTRLRDTQQLLQQHRSDLERAMFELASLKESAQNNNQKNYDLLLRISQEIHRPLAGIMGMTNLLLLSSLTDEQRRFAENARDHARLLLQRADTIQDFAQASFDATMVKSLDFDLHEILKNAVRSHLSQAQKKHLELSFQLPRDVPRSLRGDAVRLEQVLSHLLDNAIRFTDQGQVAVSASRLAGPPPNLLLKFEVRDTGTGISPEDQARLFIAGGSSIDPKSGGLGLSLVVCRYLVKLMHGEIGVSSEPGIGSTFWFTVSMEEASILHN